MPAAASKAGKWSANVCWCLTTQALLPLGWSSPVQPIPIPPRFPQLDRAVASHHGNSTRLTSSMCGGKKLKNRQFETSLGYTASLSPAWTARPLRKQEQNHEVLCEPVLFFVSFLHSPETSRNHRHHVTFVVYACYTLTKWTTVLRGHNPTSPETTPKMSVSKTFSSWLPGAIWKYVHRRKNVSK